MKTRVQNQLNMVAAVLSVLDKDEFKPVWENQDPLVFTRKVTELREAKAAIQELGKKQTQSIKGTTEDKSDVETQLEDLLITEAGLLVSYYQDQHDPVNLAKVNRGAGEIRNLANQELLSLGATVGDLAEAVTVADPEKATAYSITVASVSLLRTATDRFEVHIGRPRGAKAARKQTTGKLDGSAKDLVKHLENMDNFIPRFRKFPEGEAFAGAWHHARQIIGLGHRFEKQPPDAVPSI